MSYLRPARRLAATLRTLTFPNFDQSIARQLFALFIAAFILIQPALLMAQRGKVALGRPDVVKTGRPEVGGPKISITTLGSPITQNFDGLASTGTNITWTDDTTVVGWYSTRTTYNSGTGSSNAGALYSFGVAGTNPVTDRALGGIGSGGTGTFYWALKLTNNTTSAIASVDISFDGEQWRDGGAATPVPHTMAFEYQAANAGTITDADTPSTGWTTFSSLDFVSPTFVNTGAGAALDGNLAANRTAKSATLTFGTPVAIGQEIWLRWRDLNDGGNDHGLAIDNFSVTATGAGDAPPSVSSTTPLDNATSVPVNSDVSVTFSETVAAPAGAFSISCANSGAHGFVLSTSDNITFTLNPTSDFTNSELCTVTVDDAQVTDADAIDPPNNMTADYVFDFTTIGALPTLSINDVSQNEGNAGTTAYTFTVSLNTTTHGGVTFDIATADGTAQDDTPATEDNDYVAKSLTGQTIPNGSDTYQFTVDVNGDSTTETNETFFVNINNLVGATSSDMQGQGTITNDDIATTPIHNIQGNGDTSPLSGQSHTTRGIVTLLRTSSNAGAGAANGFFLQDPSADADPNTSEGIFVFTSGVPTYTAGGAVAVGDELFVTGTVTEFNGLTEITSVTNITVIDTGNSLPTAVTLDVTILDATALPTKPQLEKYESMRMLGTSLKSVAPNDSFFDVYTVLSSVPRSMREPGIERSLPVPPDPTSGTPDANIPIWDENPERIKLDFNGRAGAPNNFYTSNVTFTNVTGPLDFAFSEWRVIPDQAPTASSNMSAVPLPTPLASEFTVAGFNIENFNNNATQRQKAALGIRDIMRLPDIIGVVEIFNLASLQALRNEVNTISPGAAYEAYLIPTPVSGITQNVGYLVNTARVAVDAVTQERTSDTYIDPATGNPDDTHDRPPLVLRARVDPTGANLPVIVVVNHPRSFIDVDLVAGAGPTVRAKRKAQAESIAGLLQELQTNNPTSSVIAVGDYNSYQFNSGYDDSIAVMKGSPTADDQIVVDASLDVVNPNFSNLIENVPADSRYSFVFEGTPQALDHVLANTVALSRNTRIAIAHMNADFPDTPASAFESNAAVPERNSDHDAPVAYFSLVAQQAAGSVLISEFRFRGPGGSQDEFVELYNNTNADINVATTDGSAGWTVVASNGSDVCRVNNATIIPARGHFLCTNINYSLTNYGGPGAALLDVGFNLADIPDGAGIALFRTNNPANYTLAERLDAVGYASVNALYREGAGFQTGAPGAEIGGNIDYSFLRTMTRATNGLPKDTGDNVADFMGVTTNGSATSIGQNLGAPGPENLASPTNRNAQFGAALLDPAVSSTAPPNRVRNLTVVPNGDNGTMSVRRTFTNNTGAPVTRLRFRIVEVTTFINPVVPGQADLRALTSSDTTAMVTGNPVPVTVRGTTLEEPPTQAIGGGWNSSLSVAAVDGGGPPLLGSIDLNTPLNIGESINVQFMLGVMTPGRFLFFLNIEADNGCVSLPAAGPSAPCNAITKPFQRSGSRR